MTTLGQRLKELRKERGKTQAQIGKLLNVSNVSVSGYENDTREPDSAALKKLSDYYGVSIDYLLGNTDMPNGPITTNTSDKIDLKKELQKSDVLSWGGREISDEELEFIRRILDGGDGSK